MSYESAPGAREEIDKQSKQCQCTVESELIVVVCDCRAVAQGGTVATCKRGFRCLRYDDKLIAPTPRITLTRITTNPPMRSCQPVISASIQVGITDTVRLFSSRRQLIQCPRSMGPTSSARKQAWSARPAGDDANCIRRIWCSRQQLENGGWLRLSSGSVKIRRMCARIVPLPTWWSLR